jgi:sulfoxide reductase heme-binding subunit YedZ
MAHVLAATQTASPLLWYVTRAMAIAGYVTLTGAVLLGMLRPIARTTNERLSWLVDITHTSLAVLAALLIAGHLLSLYFDPFLPFSLLNLVVPAHEPYRPLATILGVYALYTIVAVLLSSWLKNAIPHGVWRALHYLGFVAFGLVTAHGILAGSDTNEPFMRAIYGASAGAVGFLVLMRLFAAPRKATAPAVAGKR